LTQPDRRLESAYIPLDIDERMSDTLSVDIDDARASGSPIDIPESLEDQVIKHWLRHHQAFNWYGKSYVIGEGVLPRRWQELSKVFTSENDAQIFLRQAFHGHLPSGVRRLNVITGAGTFPRDQIASALAHALFTRMAWVILKRATPPIEKASPAVFAKVNATYGTRVNFEFLAQWEGGQVLHGYVPCQNGVVAGRSGLSIATGFDIGQLSAKQLEALHFSTVLYDLFSPFVNHRFTKMSHAKAAKAIAAIGAPVPVITKSQADEIDCIVHLDHLKAAIVAWDRDRKPGIPKFTMLPVAWQTVLFSRTFHIGKGMSRSKIAHKFYAAATSGHWKKAIEELRNFPVTASWYKARVIQEADYLRNSGTPKIFVTEQIIRQAVKDAQLKMQQKGGVSIPRIQEYVDRLNNGELPPPIKVDNGIIVDGNHRYIAGRIVGTEPPIQPWLGGNPNRVTPWQDLKIDPNPWPGEGTN
jgi:hypothetical protein